MLTTDAMRQHYKILDLGILGTTKKRSGKPNIVDYHPYFM